MLFYMSSFYIWLFFEFQDGEEEENEKGMFDVK